MARHHAAKAVTYRSDKSEGPTAGTETVEALEFLARVLVHVPDKGPVTTRYYGWYANRPRGMRRQAEPVGAVTPVPMVVVPKLAPTEATRRWAAVIDQILTHLRTRATVGARPGARSPPSIGASVARGARRRSTERAASLHAP